MHQIGKENELNSDIGQWLKENNIPYDWEADGQYTWWELYNNGNLALQLDKRLSFAEFFRIIKLLAEDINRQDLPIDEYFMAARDLKDAEAVVKKINSLIPVS